MKAIRSLHILHEVGRYPFDCSRVFMYSTTYNVKADPAPSGQYYARNDGVSKGI